MPKKSVRNVRDTRIGKKLETCKIAASADVIVKQFRSIQVNVKNAKRWLLMKKRLSLVTDDELLVYLLDIAEPIIRRDGKCSNPGDWKTDQDKENDLEVIKNEEKDVHNVEEPLRRSPRKQCIVQPIAANEPIVVSISTEIPEVSSKSPQTTLPEVVAKNHESRVEKRRSRIKHHHKTKEKHHRDKARTKRKHSSRNDASTEKKSSKIQDEERSVLVSRVNDEIHDENDEILRKHGITLSTVVTVPKMMIERLSLNDKQSITSTNVDNENSPPLKNFHKNKRSKTRILKKSQTKTRERITEKEKPDIENKPTDSGLKYDSEDFSKIPEVANEACLEDATMKDEFNDQEEKISVEEKMEESLILDDENVSMETTLKKGGDEKKPKNKRRKHSKDSSLNEKVTTKEDEIPADEVKFTTTETDKEVIRKRRKKNKHKRGCVSSTNHREKKFHDVRKAPLDGIIEGSEMIEGIVEDTKYPINEFPISAISEDNIADKSLTNVESIPEIPEIRLAIKIKLCLNCNVRHIKDSCPLTSTENRIEDRLTFDDWCKRHRRNLDVTRAISIEDPMSEGYAVANDDNDDSGDDEIGFANEQTKNKSKIVTDGEDKQLNLNDDRPFYSRDSLPDCFELKMTTSLEHGIGIFAVNTLPIYTKFGPIVGNPIREMDIPDDFSMRHIWEIENDGKTSYMSTTNPLKSNWMRYVRPADTKEDRNVMVVTKNGELYLVSTQEIVKGTELTYWAESQSSGWTRKNKVDKSNCGGCNLNFTHPIYYRLHCCIFHDTRYSLTIRKYHCKVCGAAVLGKDNIMKHAADLHGGRGAYQCQYCRKFFLRLNYLEMHRTYGCSQNPQRSRPLCDFCGRKFCQPQKLKVHIKRMHSEMSEVLREFQCKMCMKLLGSRAALQRHMKEVHHKDVVAAATCDRCGKMFQNKSNLKIHMLTHSGVKPFKCKENSCKAAFTTKQCLQFHYKKVHLLSEDMMPKIERSVAYTFDAYSGGLLEDMGQDEKMPENERRGSQENSNSVMSLDDCSSEHSSRGDVSISSLQPTMNEVDNVAAVSSTSRYNLDRYILDREDQDTDMTDRELPDPDYQDREMEEREKSEQEIQEREDREIEKREIEETDQREREIEENDQREREIEAEHQMQELPSSPIARNCHQEIIILSSTDSSLKNERPSSEVDYYGTRLQSKGSKKWMGQFTSIDEPEIVTHHQQQHQQHQQHQQQQQQQQQNDPSTRSDVYDFDETIVKKDEDGNDAITTNHTLMTSSKLGLNIYRRSESTNASLLVEAALDAAERDIGAAVASPIIDSTDHRDSGIYSISGQLRQNEGHLSSYIQQQDDLMSSSTVLTDNRKIVGSSVQIDYHLHRPIDYINSTRNHSIEQYLPQDDLPRSPESYSINMQQDNLISPSSTPNENRYQPDIHHHHSHHQHHQQQEQQSFEEQERLHNNNNNNDDHHHQHHHQQQQHLHHNHHEITTDNLSSDEGDSVAQNLSISVKEKSLQLDPSTSYKYEQLDAEFPRDRTTFEPLVLNNGELQGLDMSARGFHQGLPGSQVTNSRYHHHLYEITERQSVDLSRNAGYSISPPPSANVGTGTTGQSSSYPHSDVLRIVSLDLTPTQSVDLSLSRSHHLHNSGGRLVNCVSPPLGSSTSHSATNDNVEGRILSSPPPPITGYNSTYPVSPAAYHPPRPNYHHYSGYY